MDSVTRTLLDNIQRSFPIVARPYFALSEILKLNEAQVIERLARLKVQKIVRQISAIFNTGALGYRSSLVAMAVPEGDLERAAAIVNSYPGVSHNYLRSSTYNMWFTIAVPPTQNLTETVYQISEAAGNFPTMILPALRKYKLAVVLDLFEENGGEVSTGHDISSRFESSSTFQPDPQNIRVVQCIQEDLPLVANPFRVWADELAMKEDDLLDLISKWLTGGIIRRFAAVLNHRQVGFNANGMVVWPCPEERIDESGAILAAFPEVSHCYYRPSQDGWPYTLYAMVHGRNSDECQAIAERLAKAINLNDYRILFSTHEFKKIRLKLFWKEDQKNFTAGK